MTSEWTNTLDAATEPLMDIEALQKVFAKTSYLLRESRKAVLQRYAVDSEAELLKRIQQAEVAEHPAYEHYLSALIIEQNRDQIRAEMAVQLGHDTELVLPSISVHLLLKENLEASYASRLAEPIRLAQDALLLSFDTGLMMEVRYFSKQEYSIMWCWGDAEFRVDTAPVHPGCASFPHHMHDEDVVLPANFVTHSGSDCWLDFSALLDVLLENPLP